MRHVATLIASTCILLVSTMSLGHVLEAPLTVQADANGDFTYDAVFTAGPGDAIVAAWYSIGIDNVGGGFFADCFCDPGCLVEEGDTILIEVLLSLDDPTQQGVAEVGVELCNGPASIAQTTILPFDPSPVTPSTWAAIKATYR